MSPLTTNAGELRQSQTLDDCITIIAPSVAEAMRQFKERGLDKLGYAIVGKVVRQRIAYASDDGNQDMFDGQPMFAATWTRSRTH